jgi:hypothetical protein
MKLRQYQEEISTQATTILKQKKIVYIYIK